MKAKERILNICTELGEDLDSPGCKQLRAYVESCPDCAAFVDSVKKTILLYQSYPPKQSANRMERLFKRLNLK